MQNRPSLDLSIGNEIVLNSLKLDENNIGPREARDLADWIKRNNESIQGLNLSGNGIGDQGVQYLANALIDNDTLTELNISKTQIFDQRFDESFKYME
jgi:Ran GTPase-activating protein (RanGAP) involved in mRNA processing and transport